MFSIPTATNQMSPEAGCPRVYGTFLFLVGNNSYRSLGILCILCNILLVRYTFMYVCNISPGTPKKLNINMERSPPRWKAATSPKLCGKTAPSWVSVWRGIETAKFMWFVTTIRLETSLVALRRTFFSLVVRVPPKRSPSCRGTRWMNKRGNRKRCLCTTSTGGGIVSQTWG